MNQRLKMYLAYSMCFPICSIIVIESLLHQFFSFVFNHWHNNTKKLHNVYFPGVFL